MTLSPEFLQFITQYTNAVLNKINRTITRKITTTFQDSDEVIPSSKLVKDEFTTVRGEIPTKTSDLTNDSGFLTQHQDIRGKEDKSNKVTSLSSFSTDDEYPSAKAVYTTTNGLSNGISGVSETFSGQVTNIWNTLGPLPSTKQDKTDNNLATTNKTVVGAINELNTNKQDKSNKVTSLSSSSTDDQYPSAKAVYDDVTQKYNSLSSGLSSVSNNIWNTLGPISSNTITLTATLENGTTVTYTVYGRQK